MKKLFIFYLAVIVATLSCKQNSIGNIDPQIEEAQKTAQLQYQFHGKYRIISATSSYAVDVDMDGTASSNLLEEIPILDFKQDYHFDVELRIYGSSSNGTYIISQAWPEQYMSAGGKEWNGASDVSYSPDYSVSYVRQGTARSFEFSKDLKEINVLPGKDENPYRWVVPESVKIDESGRLHFVNIRNLYTKNGVKKVTITTVYERFSNIT